MSLLKKYKSEVDAFIRVCHALAQKGYVTSCGGNLAWRLDDVILITATCLPKGGHTCKDVVFLNPDGTVREGKRRPTGELPMYLKLFKERPDVNSIIHCHPPFCCAFAVTKGENLLMKPVFPEIILEIGPVPLVPYATPLTGELARRFVPFLPKYNAFLMENHGMILVTQKDIAWAYGLVEELESAAGSLISAQAMGGVKEISREHLAELDAALSLRSLPACGAPGHNRSLVDLYYPGDK